MTGSALIAAAGLLAFGAWRLAARGQGDGIEMVEPEWFDAQSGARAESGAWGSIVGVLLPMRLWKMADVAPQMLSLPNVAALLRVIRAGEGTADEAGYRRLFGGALFEGFADHPRRLVVKNGYRSTAAGAYQFLESTWDETARRMNLPDFSPRSQDLAALGRIAARGALDDAIAGRLGAALAKIAPEWASMPGSPYGQPTISSARAAQVFAASGGTLAA